MALQNSVFPQSGDPDDGARFAQLKGQSNQLDYVEQGLDIQPDYTNSNALITDGVCFISKDFEIAVSDQQEFQSLGYAIQLGELTVSLPYAENFIAIAPDWDNRDAINVETYSTAADVGPDELLIGSVDTDAQTSSVYNREPDIETGSLDVNEVLSNAVYVSISDIPTDVAEEGAEVFTSEDGLVVYDTSGPSDAWRSVGGTDTFEVADQAGRLALDANSGDMALQQDTNETYVLDGDDPATDGDWTIISTHTTSTGAVDTVFGRDGSVVAQSGDYDHSQITNQTSSDHHEKYLDSEAVSAVNAETSLSVDIGGDASTVGGFNAVDLFTNTDNVADQAGRLALDAETGDIAVQDDTNEAYILQGSDPSTDSEWQLLPGGGGGGAVSVSDGGTEVLSESSGFNFGNNLDVTADGDGTVTVDSAGGSYSDSDAVSAINTDSDHGSTAAHNYYTDTDAVSAVNAETSLSVDIGGDASTVDDFNAVDLFTNTDNVADQSARLALDAETGDIAIQDDTNEAYILQGSDPSTDSEWQLLPGGGGTSGTVGVEDGGTQVLSDAASVNFGTNLNVTDDTDGTVTVDASGGSVSAEDSGTEVLADSDGFNFGTNLSVTDDTDGSVTVDASSGGTVSAEDSGTTVVSESSGFNFGSNLTVTDDGDGSVTVDGDGSSYTDSDAVSAVNAEASLTVDISGDADTVDGYQASDLTVSASDSGTEVVAESGGFNFGSNLTVTDDTDGTVTVDASGGSVSVQEDGTEVLSTTTINFANEDTDPGVLDFNVSDDGNGNAVIEAFQDMNLIFAPLFADLPDPSTVTDPTIAYVEETDDYLGVFQE